MSRGARHARRRCKVGSTFELRALSLGVSAGMHTEHTGTRRARLRRRTSNLVQVAPSSSYSVMRSSCKDGAIVVQDWCPAFSIAGGGEVRFLDGSGANAKPHSAAVACCTAPKGLPPVRVGRAAYVERGGDDDAAGVFRCRRWRYIAS